MKNFLFSLLIACALATPCSNLGADKKIEKPSADTPKVYKNVDAKEFDKLRQNGTNVVVLDVRTKEEYEEGHIPGALLVDFNSPDFNEKIARLDKSKTYLVHCAAGGRSARACKKMDTMNFQKVYNL